MYQLIVLSYEWYLYLRKIPPGLSGRRTYCLDFIPTSIVLRITDYKMNFLFPHRGTANMVLGTALTSRSQVWIHTMSSTWATLAFIVAPKWDVWKKKYFIMVGYSQVPTPPKTTKKKHTLFWWTCHGTRFSILSSLLIENQQAAY